MSQLPALAEQLSLAGIQLDDGQELLRIEADEATGRCNASSLDARKGLRSAILEALAQRFGTRTVAKAFSVSREVVRALRTRAECSGELDHVKKGLAGDAFALARMAIDRISDEIDDMPRASLPIVAGVMIDKAQLLSGGVTQRVERREAAAVGDVEAYMKGLLAASSIEVVSGAVEAGENASLKALGDARPVIEIGVVEQAETVAVDKQSTVICPAHEATQQSKADAGRNDPQKEDAA